MPENVTVLPERLEKTWLLYLKLGVGSEVARALGVTRQAVSKNLREFRQRLARMFFTVVETFSCEIVEFNLHLAYMVCALDRVKLYLFYVPGKGLRGIVKWDGKLFGAIPDLARHFAEMCWSGGRGELEIVMSVLERIERGEFGVRAGRCH